MNANIRNLRLDVCDYSGNVVCNLYDNLSDTSGRATDVFVTSERNGWKELSFTIPSKVYTDEGMEDNYRIKYLIADYRIRLMDDYETDWYLISEPKITHNKKSKNVSVVANHISMLLKQKKMDLEFSDEEGNNVGTARQLLETILEGTGWTCGNVAQFMEKDQPNVEKVRSLVASAKTGAFKMIASMCELFDAKPIYHGNEMTVDVLPMNPFSEKLNDDGTPVEVVDNNIPVLELHYDRNAHNIQRTLNTENICTKLYAYGSYGDREGLCSLQRCEHKEYTMVISGNGEYYFSDGTATYYFYATNARGGDTVVWSMLDATSMSYVWNNREKKAYHVYKKPKYENRTSLTPSVSNIRNYFSFITDFGYYDSVGLLSDDLLQKIAIYQRTAPALLASAEEIYEQVIETQNELSVIAEHNTGFLKLNVIRYEEDGNYLKLILDSSQPVLYRSDYDEPRRRLFTWYVAEELKENGDPVSGVGSVVYAINPSVTPARWRKGYVKKVNDNTEDYIYSAKENDDPNSLVVWLNTNEVNVSNFPIDRTHFYLYCTNSISGKLGVKESEAEALTRTLQQTTKQVTEIHPTYFGWDSDPLPDYRLVQNSYGWFYRSFRDETTLGNLYFCYGLAGDTIWRRVYVSETPPTVVAGEYYFNPRTKLLYHGETQNGILQWVEIGDSGIQIPSHNKYYAPDAEAQRLTNNFSKVVFYCLKRDMLYKGLYDRYEYTTYGDLIPGNYAFEDEYGFIWTFTTDQVVTTGKKIILDTASNNVFQGEINDNIVKAEIKTFDTIDYPLVNELSNVTFNQGAIDRTTHVEYNTEDYVRSNNITLNYSTRYDYHLPSGSYIIFYDSNRRYLDSFGLENTGYFTTSERVRYVRFVCPSIPMSDHYVRVHDYLNRLFISRKQYQILGKVKEETLSPKGNRIGINELIPNLVTLSDQLYLERLLAYNVVAQQITDQNNQLATDLGDLYREGWWQKDSYVEGDEDKLYADAKENLDIISRPEPNYTFTFLDLYGSEQGLTADDRSIADWPDINMSYAAHLIDPDINVDEWAFIDKIEKCYDKPWETKVSIDTNLSLLNQHSFTDVISHIADVAQQTKANQSVYKRACNISGSGKMATDKLEGAIKANVTLLQGGASNWYTDPKGNIVMESADGNSAMMLTGAGYMISNTKDKWGEWEWRSTMTGDGMTADAIYTGLLSGVLIEAGSITTDKINASVGQELEIGSNKALELYATIDGFRPSGSLHTTDALIDIRAGYMNKQGQTIPASISVLSGGEINLKAGSNDNPGGKMNIESNGELNVKGGTVNLESGGSMAIKSGSTLSIQANSEFLVDSPNFSITKDQQGNYAVSITGTVNADAGNIAGFTLGKATSEGVTRHYMHAGEDNSLDSTSNGVYIGTDGINIGGGAFKFSADGTKSHLTIAASDIVLGQGITLGSELTTAKSTISGAALTIDATTGTIGVLAANNITINSGSSVSVLTNGTVSIGSLASPFTIGSSGRKSFIYNNMPTLDSTNLNGIYLGTDGISLGGGNFIVTNGGVLTAQSGTIGGWEIEASGIHKGDFWLNRIANNVVVDNTVVVQAGKQSQGQYPFQVTSGGALVAKGAIVDGDLIAKSLTLQNSSVNVDGSAQAFFFHADFNQFKSEYTTYTSQINAKTTFLQNDGHLQLEAITETKSGKTTRAGIEVDVSGRVILSSTYFDSLGKVESGIEILPNKITVGSAGSISLGTGSASIELNDSGINLKTNGVLNIDASNVTFTNASLPFGSTKTLLGQLQGVDNTIGDLSSSGYSTIAQAINSIKLEVGAKYGKVNGIYITDAGIQLKASESSTTSNVDITTNGININSGSITISTGGKFTLNGGEIDIASGNFKVDTNGNVTCKKILLQTSDNDGQTTSTEYRSLADYPMWKLNYGVIKRINGNSVETTLGNFNTAAAVNVVGSWSGNTYTANPKIGSSDAGGGSALTTITDREFSDITYRNAGSFKYLDAKLTITFGGDNEYSYTFPGTVSMVANSAYEDGHADGYTSGESAGWGEGYSYGISEYTSQGNNVWYIKVGDSYEEAFTGKLYSYKWD